MKTKLAFLAILAACLVAVALEQPLRYGDGLEYYLMTESLFRHGSPELQPGDVEAVSALDPEGKADIPKMGFPVGGFFPTVDGQYIGWHFWGYSLSAVPARWLLPKLGLDPLSALPVTNALWFLAAVAVILFVAPGGWSNAGYLALTLAGPAWWYIRFTGPEVMSWSCATMAIALLQKKDYACAALAGAMASWQNPPAALVALAIGLLSLRSRKWFTILATGVCASAVALPPLYFRSTLGVWNPIAAQPEFVAGTITFERTWGLVFDWNQGMFPFQPFAVVLGAIGCWKELRSNRWEAIGLALAFAGMVILVQRATNWNSACMGVARYSVWMLPILNWWAARAIASWPRRGLAVLGWAFAAHIGLVFGMWPARMDYVKSTFAARTIWTYVPWLDAPDPHVFYTRVTHRDMPFRPQLTPLAFLSNEPGATKLMLHRDTLDRLWDRFDVTPEYRTWLKSEAAKHEGVFFVHPPSGAVTPKPGEDGKPPVP